LQAAAGAHLQVEKMVSMVSMESMLSMVRGAAAHMYISFTKRARLKAYGGSHSA